VFHSHSGPLLGLRARAGPRRGAPCVRRRCSRDRCVLPARDRRRARAGAKSLELRAATSAARVWGSRGERALARDTLARSTLVHRRLRHTDLVAARSLLDTLG
jgi:hypothetical protein